MKTQVNYFFLMCAFAMLFSCKEKNTGETTNEAKNITVNDVHSYAKPDEAVVKHLALELTVDFAIKKLSGTCIWLN